MPRFPPLLVLLLLTSAWAGCTTAEVEEPSKIEDGLALTYDWDGRRVIIELSAVTALDRDNAHREGWRAIVIIDGRASGRSYILSTDFQTMRIDTPCLYQEVQDVCTHANLDWENARGANPFGIGWREMRLDDLPLGDPKSVGDRISGTWLGNDLRWFGSYEPVEFHYASAPWPVKIRHREGSLQLLDAQGGLPKAKAASVTEEWPALFASAGSYTIHPSEDRPFYTVEATVIDAWRFLTAEDPEVTQVLDKGCLIRAGQRSEDRLDGPLESGRTGFTFNVLDDKGVAHEWEITATRSVLGEVEYQRADSSQTMFGWRCDELDADRPNKLDAFRVFVWLQGVPTQIKGTPNFAWMLWPPSEFPRNRTSDHQGYSVAFQPEYVDDSTSVVIYRPYTIRINPQTGVLAQMTLHPRDLAVIEERGIPPPP